MVPLEDVEPMAETCAAAAIILPAEVLNSVAASVAAFSSIVERKVLRISETAPFGL